MATVDRERLAALEASAAKLGYQVDMSVDRQGYCLWRLVPGGRHMVVGREGGVTLDTIAENLDTIAKNPDTVANKPSKLEGEARKNK